LKILRSIKVLATTGSAVIESAVPTKSAKINLKDGSFIPRKSGKKYAAKKPIAKGNTIPMTLVYNAVFPCLNTNDRLTSKPETKRSIITARFVIPSIAISVDFELAKIVLNISGARVPKTVGPIIMPASISPTTDGCLIKRNNSPNTLAASNITLIAIRNRVISSGVKFIY